mmetsp:Transcript_24653/g.37461  ORF Transcript_24653/g.37461 Transcript_24653/m.37461 type:complete len:326 (+) Transcript_24653:239-1216(+)
MKRQCVDAFGEEECKINGESSKSDSSLESDTREPVECYENCVDSEQKCLFEDVTSLWDKHGGSKDKAKSFWVPYSSKPRCLLEATALQIGKFHLQDFEFSGVEFWAQYRRSNDGLGFHFDKDEHAAREENVWKHPALATATYLSNEGAPLVVFETYSAEDTDAEEQKDHSEETGKRRNENIPSNPPRAWIVFPSQGRHVVFSGGLLHGVASEVMVTDQAIKSTGTGGRLSFLVNVWVDHKPKEVQQLTNEMIEMFTSNVEGAFQLTETSSEALCTEDIEVLPDSKVINLKEHVQGDTGPLPCDEILQIRTKIKNPPYIKLTYKDA